MLLSGREGHSWAISTKQAGNSPIRTKSTSSLPTRSCCLHQNGLQNSFALFSGSDYVRCQGQTYQLLFCADARSPEYLIRKVWRILMWSVFWLFILCRAVFTNMPRERRGNCFTCRKWVMDVLDTDRLFWFVFHLAMTDRSKLKAVGLNWWTFNLSHTQFKIAFPHIQKRPEH